ncbi:MAG: hypothetical protein LC130_03205 [Bryobacterales bacterium]|nr:hypothetical protein [Bryobacterales bacterium]
MLFLFGNFDAERFGGTLDMVGIDLHTRQLCQQLAAFLEAHQGSHGGDHPRHGRRQGGVLQAQLAIAWAEPLPTCSTVEVGAPQPQRPEHAHERFLPPACVAGQLPALTPRLGQLGVGMIGIQALLDGAAGQVQRLPSHRVFKRLQIQLIEAWPAGQRLNVPQNFSREQAFERGFL